VGVTFGRHVICGVDDDSTAYPNILDTPRLSAPSNKFSQFVSEITKAFQLHLALALIPYLQEQNTTL
jgi:hypothetical protein